MSRRSRTIGLFLPMRGVHGPLALRGVMQYVDEHAGLNVISFCSHEESFMEPAKPPTRTPPWTGRVDGAVVFLQRFPGFNEWIQSGGVPVVNTISETIDSPVVTVSADPASMARTAIDHLAGLGYQHFAYVGFSEYHGSQLRCKALAKELASRKLRLLKATEIEDNDLFQTERIDEFTRLDQANRTFVELVKTASKPLALIAGNDVIADVMCRIVGWLGLRIPEDVAVLCLYDSNLATVVTPPVTAIRIPSEQVGYEAARVLQRLMEGKRVACRNVAIAAEELIVRESTVRQQSASHDAVGRARELIRREGGATMRVQEVAARVCMAVRTLELQFVAAYGHSVIEEIRQARLERIKELLDTTDLSARQIATRMGYSGGVSLAVFFRGRTKLTPTQYRRRRRKKAAAT